MDTFEKILELQKDLLQAQLKTIYQYQQKDPDRKKRTKRMSKIDIVEDILTSAQEPVHIADIIGIALKEYNGALERDSIVLMQVFVLVAFNPARCLLSRKITNRELR